MKDILVIDNYDSFTYNLVHIIRELGMGDRMDVFRNDKIELDEVGDYRHILLSPGPGLPGDAGIMPQVISTYGSSKNILGVCLGHQGIGEAFGGNLYNLPIVYHGVVTEISLTVQDDIFEGVPDTFNVCRYHSWIISEEGFPKDLNITARDANGQIMAIKHRSFNIRGVQFHPESIMTEHGVQIIHNWLKIAS